MKEGYPLFLELFLRRQEMFGNSLSWETARGGKGTRTWTFFEIGGLVHSLLGVPYTPRDGNGEMGGTRRKRTGSAAVSLEFSA